MVTPATGRSQSPISDKTHPVKKYFLVLARVAMILPPFGQNLQQ